MAETKWEHLKELLRITDNHDTLPSNRPFHVTCHFINRFRSMKKTIWKDSRVSGWGTIENFFERVEFQNRGAAHVHTCLWTTATIEQMIISDQIRGDLPHPEREPELYRKVVAHQIHNCSPRHCGGPPADGEQCSKFFPRPYSTHTYHDNTSLRYIYRCTKPEDRWVVPYHPPTLLAWNAHMNAQYVTTKGFARYMTKYIAKVEPAHLFNISEGNRYHQHILARRLGTMEVMFLTLGETICNSSATVIYLPTDPPKLRSKTVRPKYQILLNPDEPYYKDAIEKYFRRPLTEEFHNVKYNDYYRHYEIKSPNYRSTRNAGIDLDGQTIVRRTKPVLTRTRFLKLSDGESYFYHRLLETRSWRSEDELSNNFGSYREHYLSLFPNETEQYRQSINSYLTQTQLQLTSQFGVLVNSLLQTLEREIAINNLDIIEFQLNNLRILPPPSLDNMTITLPTEQYKIMNVLTNVMGSRTNRQHRFFFLTGSAGTGKSFIIHQFKSFLERSKRKYILLAPTGVAAQNVGGKTIHSELKITSDNTSSSYKTLIFSEKNTQTKLKEIDTIIIEEISMVSSTLFTFLSEIFARLHQTQSPFGNVNVLVVGDLAQLPPVNGSFVFHSPVWRLFYPLFLRNSQRQQNDPMFYKLLEEIRFDRISPESWEVLKEKHQSHNNQPYTLNSLDATDVNPPNSIDIITQNLLNTTHIVGYRESANRINVSLCNLLPVHNQDEFLVHTAIDIINNEIWDEGKAQPLFKSHTNLPLTVRLQTGARVMYLNNDMYQDGICNGTVGIVTHVDADSKIIRVAFLSISHKTIVDAHITPKSTHFTVNGNQASRTQFPLQNCFALTVHKSQGLTLPKISAFLDSQFFAPGQAYVALSRAPSWDAVEIPMLDKAAFLVDKSVTKEYERLENIAQTHQL